MNEAERIHNQIMDNQRLFATQNVLPVNGAGVPIDKLHASTGRPKGARNLRAKHPSSLAKRLKLHGVDWVECLALSIKAAGNMDYKPALRAQARDDVRMWLRALPYLVTTTNTVKVRKWKGKASKAALVALDALEGR
jgi:hypothetical protein